MSIDTRFGADLTIGGQETSVSAEEKIAALRQATIELAESFTAGEIGQQEFTAALKALNADLRVNEQAFRLLASAQREQAQEEARSAAAAAAAAAEAGAEYRAMAQARATAASAELAHQSELDALAIQHETEMLAHEARQLAVTEAAQDRELVSLQQSITAREAVEVEAAQVAAALAKEAAARGGLTLAEEREIAAVAQSIGAQNMLESEAEQITTALRLEEGALLQAARATGSYTIEVSAAASAQTKLANAAGNSRAKMSSFQQSMTSASFMLQDFTSTSGDLGAKLNSISNNLPMFFVGMGGLGIAVSAAGTAAIALYRSWDTLTNLMEEKNPFPKVAGDISGMKRELDAGKEAMEKFEKAGAGTAEQLATYNEVRERTAFLEREIADQQERQSRLKKALEAPTDEAEGRAKGFQEAVKGHGQETLDNLAQGFANAAADELSEAWKARTLAVEKVKAANLSEAQEIRALDSINQVYKDQKKVIEARDPAKQAEDLMDALLKGEENAFRSLDQLIKHSGNLFGNLTRRIDDANPHLKMLWETFEEEAETSIKSDTDRAKKLAEEKKKGNAVAMHALDLELKAALEEATREHAAREAVNKIRLEASHAAADDAARIWKDAGAREKAEAERVLEEAGKGVVDIFRDLVKASGLPAEKGAAQAVGQFAQQFQAGGAGAGAADLAARAVAARAGFAVAPRRELAGPATPAPNTIAGRRIAAARKEIATPEWQREKRRILAEQKKAALEKATAQRKASIARRQQQRRRKAPADAGAAPGLRSIAPTPEPVAQQRGNNQTALPRVLDQVAQVQTAVAGAQAIDAQLLTRLAVIERRTLSLEAANRGLLNRAGEQQPTASNSGSSVF
jgi:trimeric autotransporter adhesin